MSDVIDAIRPKRRRWFPSVFNERILRWLSLNWPRFWRVRGDLLVSFFFVMLLVTAVLFFFGTPTAVEGVGTIMGFTNVFFALAWIVSITRPPRLREVIRYADSPSFTTIFFGVLGIVTYPYFMELFINASNVGWHSAIETMLNKPAIAEQPNGQRDIDFYLIMVGTWVSLAAVFTKLICLSSVSSAFGATFIAGVTSSISVGLGAGLSSLVPSRYQPLVVALAVLAIYLSICLAIMRRELFFGRQTQWGRLFALSLLWTVPAFAAFLAALVLTVCGFSGRSMTISTVLVAAIVCDIVARIVSRLLLQPKA